VAQTRWCVDGLAATAVSEQPGRQPSALSPTGLAIPLQDGELAQQYTARYGQPDLTKGRSLLKSVGFRYPCGRLYEPNGKPFSLTIIGSSTYTDVIADYQARAHRQLRAASAAARGDRPPCLTSACTPATPPNSPRCCSSSTTGSVAAASSSSGLTTHDRGLLHAR